MDISWIKNIIEIIEDSILYPFRKIKYGILWIRYYRIIKHTEIIIANRTLIMGSVNPFKPNLQITVMNLLSDINSEFYKKPKNYSLLFRKVDTFFDFMDPSTAENNIGHRICRVKIE